VDLLVGVGLVYAMRILFSNSEYTDDRSQSVVQLRSRALLKTATVGLGLGAIALTAHD
jgi:hypothetical protein